MSEQMDQSLFRQESIKELSTPDDLTSYLRVTGAGVWVALLGIIVILAGLAVWGIFGRIISTVTVPAYIEDGKVSCFVLAEDVNLSDDNIEISIGDVKMTASTEDVETITMDSSAPAELYASGYLSPGKNVVILKSTAELQNGYYEAVVTTETLHPISLLFSN